jgi:hypothetical protein
MGQQQLSNKLLFLGVASFLIIALFTTPSQDFEIYAAPRDPNSSGGDCDADFVRPGDTIPGPEGADAKQKCCWDEEDLWPDETDESYYIRFCQWCYYDTDKPSGAMLLDCGDPFAVNRALPSGSVVGPNAGVVEPFRPPTPKDDAMNPLAGGGIENPTTTPQTPLTDQNVVPGGGVVEQSNEIPSSKGTKSPLDTILGFNGPPTTDDSDNSETPTTSEDGTSERRLVFSPTGGCMPEPKDRCIPCDPGLAGAYCVHADEWESGKTIDTGLPTSKNTPGPLIMSPPEDQSGENESPLLADESTQSPTSTPESAELAPPDPIKCLEGQHWDEHLQMCIPDVKGPDLPGPDPNPELSKDLEAEGSPGQSSPTDEVAEQSSDEVGQESDDNNGNN